MNHSEKRFTMEELVRLVDLPKRTVRYYIQRGLVDRPEGPRRTAWYTSRHLEQLLAIKRWQRAGLSLERIGEILRQEARGEPPPPAPARPGDVEVWSRLHIARGLELHIEPGRTGLSPEKVRRLAREIGEIYRELKEEGSAEQEISRYDDPGRYPLPRERGGMIDDRELSSYDKGGPDGASPEPEE